MRTWLVTGGAGFIGSNFVHMVRSKRLARVINLDKLTYAGHLTSLDTLRNDVDHVFIQGDIGDAELLTRILTEHRPEALINFAAETHVDRSIIGPQAFIETNVVGTHTLLANVRHYWQEMTPGDRGRFRFLHVSTDEVYGTLAPEAPAFSEENPYRPNSPYAASKAAADHLVRAYFHTYGLPTLVTNCSNNYGSFQHPEKFIPLMILSARSGQPMPVYGDGRQVRDWLFVEDHCVALLQVLEHGRVGECYNIGADNERTNLDVVQMLCGLLDAMFPGAAPHARLITHVTDRPGHDRRYAIDAGKIARELGWRPRTGFEDGLARTVRWYVEHADWVLRVSSEQHRRWLDLNYQSREKMA